MLRGRLNTESSCDIDEDMTWIQSTIYKFAFQRTFGTVSFSGTKLIVGVIDSSRVSNALGACQFWERKQFLARLG